MQWTEWTRISPAMLGQGGRLPKFSRWQILPEHIERWRDSFSYINTALSHLALNQSNVSEPDISDPYPVGIFILGAGTEDAADWISTGFLFGKHSEAEASPHLCNHKYKHDPWNVTQTLFSSPSVTLNSVQWGESLSCPSIVLHHWVVFTWSYKSLILETIYSVSHNNQKSTWSWG